MLLSLASTIITVVQAVYIIQLCKNLKTVKPEQGKKGSAENSHSGSSQNNSGNNRIQLESASTYASHDVPSAHLRNSNVYEICTRCQRQLSRRASINSPPSTIVDGGRVYFSLTFYAMKFSEPYRNSNFVSYCSVGCSSIGSELRPTTSPVSAST